MNKARSKQNARASMAAASAARRHCIPWRAYRAVPLPAASTSRDSAPRRAPSRRPSNNARTRLAPGAARAVRNPAPFVTPRPRRAPCRCPRRAPCAVQLFAPPPPRRAAPPCPHHRPLSSISARAHRAARQPLPRAARQPLPRAARVSAAHAAAAVPAQRARPRAPVSCTPPGRRACATARRGRSRDVTRERGEIAREI